MLLTLMMQLKMLTERHDGGSMLRRAHELDAHKRHKEKAERLRAQIRRALEGEPVAEPIIAELVAPYAAPAARPDVERIYAALIERLNERERAAKEAEEDDEDVLLMVM